ncbi:MAG: hypothetical protein RBS68_06035, partial [Anaerolineales bacterium]|nr:hypothetical protein [Anaerolineales bacterium]
GFLGKSNFFQSKKIMVSVTAYHPLTTLLPAAYLSAYHAAYHDPPGRPLRPANRLALIAHPVEKVAPQKPSCGFLSKLP